MKRIYPKQVFEGKFSGWYGRYTYYDLAVRHSKFSRETGINIFDAQVELSILNDFANKKGREPGPHP